MRPTMTGTINLFTFRLGLGFLLLLGCGELSSSEDSSVTADTSDHKEELSDSATDTSSSADLASLEAIVETQQSTITQLEATQSKLLCFIDHMTDEERWDPNDEVFEEIEASALNSVTWRQGPNTDSSVAYEDCF